MSCEGRRLPSAGSGVITSALHLLGLRLPLEVERLFTERSSASEKLVFKIQVIRRPRFQMDGFLRLFVFPSLPLSLLSLSLTAEYMMLAIKWRTALYTRVAFRDQGAMSSSVLSWTHHSAEGWHLLSHSHNSDNYHCKQSSAGPKSNAEEFRLCVWAAFRCGSNKERERERERDAGGDGS